MKINNKPVNIKRLKHKYGAVRCQKDGINFPSKLEKRYYERLIALQKSGKILFFLRQVGFDLPGKVRYFCDFQVFWSDGTIEFIDTKGVMTETSRMKIKMTEALNPIEIKIVRKF